MINNRKVDLDEMVDLPENLMKDFGYINGKIKIRNRSINEAGYCNMPSKCSNAKNKKGYCKLRETDEYDKEYKIYDVDFNIRAKQKLYKHVHDKRGILQWAKAIIVREKDIKNRPRVGVTYSLWCPSEEEEEQKNNSTQQSKRIHYQYQVCTLFFYYLHIISLLFIHYLYLVYRKANA